MTASHSLRRQQKPCKNREWGVAAAARLLSSVWVAAGGRVVPDCIRSAIGQGGHKHLIWHLRATIAMHWPSTKKAEKKRRGGGGGATSAFQYKVFQLASIHPRRVLAPF